MSDLSPTSGFGDWPVDGHEWAVDLLQHSLASDRLAHALLFTGPPQIGKTTLAMVLAQALNCQGVARPCGRCRACKRIAHGNHPDVRVIQAEAGKGGREGILKIDQIRALQREVALAPMESRYKVFLLLELERANLPAANALLKTLEEPPPAVILLLTSARPHALLPTIVSRCQIVPLRTLSAAQVSSALVERWNAEPQRADLLARLSGGRLGWAADRLTDEVAWEERTRRLVDARQMPAERPVKRLAYAEELSRSADTALQTLVLWSSWWRDLLLVQQGSDVHVNNIDLAAELEESARQFDPADVRAFLARLQVAPLQLRQNANTRLLVESLLLSMPRPASAG